MCTRRSHMLAPLSKLTSIKINHKLTEVEQDDFFKIKRIVARNTLLTYPDFDETFKIHNNASAFQLGAVIIQKGKPIAFYSRQFTDAQQRYREKEKEIVIIVELLKEFRKILLGHKL